MDGAHRHVGLLERNIEIGLRILGDVLVFGVLYNSYNFDERTLRALDAEAFAKGVFFWPELLGHLLIDDGNERGFFAVGIGKLSPAQQGHLDGVEISGGHNVVINIRRLLAGLERTVFKGKRIAGANEAHRNGKGLGDRFNAGQSTNATFHFAVHFPAASFLVTDLRDVDGKIEDVFRVEAEADLLRLVQTANKETSHHQQDQRASHLSGDERISGELTARTGGGAAASFMENGDNVRASGSQGGHDADNQPRQQDGSKSKQIDSRVGMKIKLDWEDRAKAERAQNSSRPGTEQQTRATTQKSQQETFREVLPDKTAMTGALCGADGHFPLAHRGAHQENIGDVETGNQKYKSSQGHESDGSGRNRVLRVGLRPGKFLRIEPDIDAFLGLRMLTGNALRENLEGGLGLLDRCTGLEPSHNREAAIGPVRPVLLNKVVGIIGHFGAERNIGVHVEDSVSSFKFLGSDTDDCERMFVDHDLFADDVRIAPKSLAPVGVAQNQNRVGAGSASFGGKNQTAVDGVNPECGKIVA